MGVFEILVIAVSLSMDSFAVNVVNGMLMPHLKFSKAIAMALVFAAFQGVLPLIGFGLGFLIENQFQVYDHWIAFGLLSLIGGKMILEGRQKSKSHSLNSVVTHIGFSKLAIQSLATSIDALIIGFGFAFVEINIIMGSMIIGTITFLFSMLGLRLGKAVGVKVRKGIEIMGGFMLILIGLKILLEHTVV